MIKSNRKGLTLIELVVAIGIFVIIGGAITVFLMQGLTLYGTELNANTDEGNLRNGMTHIISSLRRTADDADITVGTGTLTVDGNTYALSGGNLTYNGSILIKGVSAFTVTKTNNVIDIYIRTAAGKTLENSYALK